MAHDHDHAPHDRAAHGVNGRSCDDLAGDYLLPYDDLSDEDIDVKEALGLPDALPPIRLLPLPELATLARQAPLPAQLAALAEWAGSGGRAVDDLGDLLPDDLAGACQALGVDSAEFAYLWEYALAVEWLVFDSGEERAVPGETASAWSSGGDEGAVTAWSSTVAAVLGETFELYGPQPDLGSGSDEAGEPADDIEFDFSGQGMALAILLFLARREGLTADEFADVLWENAGGVFGDLDADALEELAEARAAWESAYGDPARLLRDKLVRTRAITEAGDVIRLTPLALAALREQLVEAGVDIPLLPPTAAELTGAQLLAMAEGVSDAEFEAEADAWTAARGADAAARELLGLAEQGQPGERMLAVAAVTRIGAAAEPAWRDSLAKCELRGYAKVTLLQLAGFDIEQGPADVPADLELGADDLAWVATDLLALACDDDFPDPDDLAVSFREAVPVGQEMSLFDTMARGTHPAAVTVLGHLGRYHPDEQVAKAARTAAHKAAARRG